MKCVSALCPGCLRNEQLLFFRGGGESSLEYSKPISFKKNKRAQTSPARYSISLFSDNGADSLVIGKSANVHCGYAEKTYW